MARGWQGLVAAVVVCWLVVPGRTCGATGERLEAMAGKLARGVVNAAAGFPSEVVARGLQGVTAPHTDTAGAAVAGLTRGVVLGAGWGVLRAASGVVDILTFPVPLGGSYGPLLEPDFAL